MPVFRQKPVRRPEETEEAYQKRVQALEAEANESKKPDDKKDPSQQKGERISFNVPPQYEEFAKYCKEHPEAKWHMSGSPKEMEKMLDDMENHPTLKGLGLKNKIEGIHLNNCEDKNAAHGAMRQLKDAGMIDKLKNVGFSKDRDLEPWSKGNNLEKEIRGLSARPTPGG